MGFHICEYCTQTGTLPHPSHSATSSGDVTLSLFDRGSGRSKWVFPDMIVHYVRDHGYQPPAEFIEDVMQGQYAGGVRWQTRGITPAKQVGYLSGDYPRGIVPEGFLEKLQQLIQKATNEGDYRQIRE